MRAYYNEFDPYCAQWLRNLIDAGHIPPGDVDDRSIAEVKADEIKGYDQWHFFAGLGGWGYAARLAGLGEKRGILTGSPPCQPFSSAGKRQGYADERHLAPVWLELVAALRPAWVFGEQVAAAIKKDDWLDDLLDALEAEGYATGAAVLPACGVGAPHIRQRLWVVARLGDSEQPGLEGHRRDGDRGQGWEEPARSVAKAGELSGVEISGNSRAGHQCRAVGKQRWDALDGRSTCLRQGDRAPVPDGRHANGESCGVANSISTNEQLWPEAERKTKPSGGSADCERPRQAETGWIDPDWLYCRDEKWRPVESGAFPLADGIPARVGRLRAYGNAIVPQAAAEVMIAAMECQP